MKQISAENSDCTIVFIFHGGKNDEFGEEGIKCISARVTVVH